MMARMRDIGIVAGLLTGFLLVGGGTAAAQGEGGVAESGMGTAHLVAPGERPGASQV